MIDLLAAANAKVIAYTVFFFEPQTDRGLAYILKIKKALADGQVSDAVINAVEVQSSRQDRAIKIITEAELALDTDATLAASLVKAGNVLLPSTFTLAEPLGKADKPLPAFALSSSLDESIGFCMPALNGQQPLEAIGTAAAAIGHLNQLPDADGAVREEPLLINYYGRAVPSKALLASLKSLNLAVTDIKLNAGQSVQLGKLKVATDDLAIMRPQFYKGHDGRTACAVDSFYDVLSGKIPASKYADKIVIIVATAAGVGISFPVPGSPRLSPAATVAHITSSILSEHFIVQPGWGV